MFKRFIFGLGFVGSIYAAEPQKMPAPVCDSRLPCYDNSPYIEADFIYWVAKQEGNNYAVTGAAITVPGTVDPNTGLTPASVTGGHSYSPDPKIKPGFKVALGMNLEHGHWDLFSEYTWLYSKAKSSVYSNDLNAGVLPIFSYTPNNSILSTTTFFASSGATGFVSGSTANWTLHFNNINLELGKAIPFGCHLTLHPHFGLQGSWQKQHLNYLYAVA